VTPLVEITAPGNAPVILSEMSTDAALTDPIALRLWAQPIGEPVSVSGDVENDVREMNNLRQGEKMKALTLQ